jgi:hypothetical protein
MTHSINHPWGISEKHRNRYGELWANLDFVFADKISNDLFKEDPMNTHIGHLEIVNQKIKMRYKDLIFLSKNLQEKYNNMIFDKNSKDQTYPIDIKGQTFQLKRHEFSRLTETISEATESTLRGYEVGLYL